MSVIDVPSPRVQTNARRVKGPKEDAWLRTFDDPDFDRNRLESLRRMLLNPDLLKSRTLHCYCGNEVSVDQSWYVMTNDGCLVCNGCASCHCCGREALPISRRLVCIDGMVLCYRCVRFFGYPRRPKIRMKVEPMSTMKNPLGTSKPPVGAAKTKEASAEDDERQRSQSLEDAQQLGIAPSSANISNSEYYNYNVPRLDRCGFEPKADERRKLRVRCYPDTPVKRLSSEDDPCVVAPAYLAENTGQPEMLCPACNSIALGPTSYVVPSMARVYHIRCFRCCNCKESLCCGYKLPGVHFDYCSCQAPIVWCFKPACRVARQMHHKMAKCRLGCIRPGGRLQIDFTMELSANAAAAETSKQRRRRKRPIQSKKRESQPEGGNALPLEDEDSFDEYEDEDRVK